MLDALPRPAAVGTRPGRRAVRLAPEAALLVALYAAYTAVRNDVHGAQAAAVQRGRDVLALERRMHLAPERTLNHCSPRTPALATAAF